MHKRFLGRGGGHLQDARDDADSGDGDFGALEPEQRGIDHRARRRPHLLIVVQGLSHALRNQMLM